MSSTRSVKWQSVAVVAAAVVAVTSIAVLAHKRRTRRQQQDDGEYHALSLPTPSISETKVTTCGAVASLAYCHALPKVELHAHLSGSVRASTALELLETERAHLVVLQRELASESTSNTSKVAEREQIVRDIASIDKERASFATETKRNPEQCWILFGILHRVLDNNAAIARVTREVLTDFAADNVMYLELRTTPREVPRTHMTKQSYVQTIVNEVTKWHESQSLLPVTKRMMVRLLLSVDRRGSIDDARATIDIARHFLHVDHGALVVGVDFSGNPTVGSFRPFREVFDEARAAGLRSSLHCAEIPHHDETTAIAMEYRADRLGHGACLEESMYEQLTKRPIPIEVCCTSNLITGSVISADKHPFGLWLEHDYPICICTDDMGVFDISLSSEYHLLATSWYLTREELRVISRRAIDFIFVDKHIQHQLRKAFDERYRTVTATIA